MVNPGILSKKSHDISTAWSGVIDATVVHIQAADGDIHASISRSITMTEKF